MVRKLILFLAAAAAIAQTRVQPGQIKNIEQVRIYVGDHTPPGTRVLVAQLDRARHIIPPEQWERDKRSYQSYPPTDEQQTIVPVCVVDWYGYGTPGANDVRIIRASACYTAHGITLLHKDPDWDAWLRARGY